MTTGSRQAVLLEAANTLLDARRTHTPVQDLPAPLQPTTLEEAYAIQDHMAQAYGEIGGYKVGAPTPDAVPIFAPMPRAWMAASGAVLAGATYRFRGIEAEIAFLLGEDLPPRSAPYSEDEVFAAIASCHPAIEELESAYIDPREVPRFHQFADLQMHGGFVYGPAIPNWQAIPFNDEKVTLTVDGTVRVERTGSNTSGRLQRLLPFLANEGAARTGGLKAGQWITTGSWTGILLADATSQVAAGFAHAPAPVSLRFQ